MRDREAIVVKLLDTGAGLSHCTSGSPRACCQRDIEQRGISMSDPRQWYDSQDFTFQGYTWHEYPVYLTWPNRSKMMSLLDLMPSGYGELSCQMTHDMKHHTT